MILLHSDFRAVGYCNKGLRPVAERHGIDWSDFVKNGIDIERLKHIDDAMLLPVIEFARARQNGQE